MKFALVALLVVVAAAQAHAAAAGSRTQTELLGSTSVIKCAASAYLKIQEDIIKITALAYDIPWKFLTVWWKILECDFSVSCAIKDVESLWGEEKTIVIDMVKEVETLVENAVEFAGCFV